MMPDNAARAQPVEHFAGRITLPPVTVTQLVFYCAAVGVTDPIHFDREFARKSGFADLVVNGSLRVAWLAQALADLAAPTGRLESFDCSHRRPMLVGAAPVIELRIQDAEPAGDGFDRIHCEAIGLADGEVADRATATLLVPAGTTPRLAGAISGKSR